MNQIELSAGTIDYQDTGGDGPTLVLLHGLLMDASLWDDVITDLSIDHRCVAPTLPLGAHRHPMRPNADLSLRGIARLVAELIDRLGPARRHPRRQRHRRGARPTARRRRHPAREPDRSRLLRRIRQLPPGSHRQDAGADREAPARDVRPVHAADAPAATAPAPDRVRVADQARRRRHRPMDPTGPAPARDPPRHHPGPARRCGTQARPTRRDRVLAHLRRPRSRRLGQRGPGHAARPRPPPRGAPSPGAAGRDTGQLHAHPPGPARAARSDRPGLHTVIGRRPGQQGSRHDIEHFRPRPGRDRPPRERGAPRAAGRRLPAAGRQRNHPGCVGCQPTDPRHGRRWRSAPLPRPLLGALLRDRRRHGVPPRRPCLGRRTRTSYWCHRRCPTLSAPPRARPPTCWS